MAVEVVPMETNHGSSTAMAVVAPAGMMMVMLVAVAVVVTQWRHQQCDHESKNSRCDGGTSSDDATVTPAAVVAALAM